MKRDMRNEEEEYLLQTQRLKGVVIVFVRAWKEREGGVSFCRKGEMGWREKNGGVGDRTREEQGNGNAN